MRRRVLIAEQDDTIRSVVETILRQEGFEVVSVAVADRAKEVLEFSRPDIMIIGGDLLAKDQTPYFEKIQQDPRASSVPMLVIAPGDGSEVSLPPEVVVSRPLDPKDFLSRVHIFLGGGDSPGEEGTPDQVVSGVEDDFLDAALGLDNINITDSEVMNRTGIVKRKGSAGSDEKLIGLDHDVDQTDNFNETGKVESLIINEDVSDIHRQIKKKAPPPPLSGTGKLEILSDQFGLTNPSQHAEQDIDQNHDYDWFINSMKADVGNAVPATPPPSKPDTSLADSGSFKIKEPSSHIDPTTPGPASVSSTPTAPQNAGVEQFIDEFKKEIEQLRVEEPGDISQSKQQVVTSGTTDGVSWEEQLEAVSPEEVRLFTRELAEAVGRHVAEKIVAKLDADKLLQLLKNEILLQRRSGQ